MKYRHSKRRGLRISSVKLSSERLSGPTCVHIYVYMEVSWNGGTPKSSIIVGFSLTNHPFGGTPFIETSIYLYHTCAVTMRWHQVFCTSATPTWIDIRLSWLFCFVVAWWWMAGAECVLHRHAVLKPRGRLRFVRVPSWSSSMWQRHISFGWELLKRSEARDMMDFWGYYRYGLCQMVSWIVSIYLPILGDALIYHH